MWKFVLAVHNLGQISMINIWSAGGRRGEFCLPVRPSHRAVCPSHRGPRQPRQLPQLLHPQATSKDSITTPFYNISSNYWPVFTNQADLKVKPVMDLEFLWEELLGFCWENRTEPIVLLQASASSKGKTREALQGQVLRGSLLWPATHTVTKTCQITSKS